MNEKITMTGAREYFNKVARENGLGSEWVFGFGSGHRRVGGCNHKTKRITVSKVLIEQGTREQVQNTILHELAHALSPMFENHGQRWKMLFIGLGGTGERTPQYKIDMPVNYVLSCENGCFEVEYMRKPKRDFTRCRCKKCRESKFKVTKVGDD